MEVGSEDVRVVNWFSQYRIPYSAIRAISSEGRFAFVLADGRTIPAVIGAGSVLSSLTGDSCCGGAPIHFDGVGFLALTAILVGVNVLTYRPH